MDMNMEIFWYEIDQVFRARIVDLIGSNFTAEEAFNRVEEILYLRDQVKRMWDEKIKTRTS